MTRFSPRDENELAELLRSAAEDEPVELLGSGSKRGLGRPMDARHTVDLGAFSGITLYEPAELVVTAGAATPLDEVEATLSASGQMLAFEPGDWRGLLGTQAAEPTLGGVLACNLAGPRRIRQGAARDHFLGLRAVSGRGEIFKAGGRVVKNVTGYDLCKLMAGSYGTLAALTEASVKVMPVPEATRSIALSGLDDRAALRAMTLALNSSHEVDGAAHLPERVSPDGASLTLARIEGPVPSVEARAALLRQELAEFGPAEILGDARSLALWRHIADVGFFAAPSDEIVWRVSLAPSAAPAFLARLGRVLDFRYFLDWGGGLVWLAVSGAEDGGGGAIRAALEGGHATLIRAPDALRLAVPVFQPQPPALAALSARVKESFDPMRILNRGRMLAER